MKAQVDPVFAEFVHARHADLVEHAERILDDRSGAAALVFGELARLAAAWSKVGAENPGALMTERIDAAAKRAERRGRVGRDDIRPTAGPGQAGGQWAVPTDSSWPVDGSADTGPTAESFAPPGAGSTGHRADGTGPSGGGDVADRAWAAARSRQLRRRTVLAGGVTVLATVATGLAVRPRRDSSTSVEPTTTAPLGPSRGSNAAYGLVVDVLPSPAEANSLPYASGTSLPATLSIYNTYPLVSRRGLPRGDSFLAAWVDPLGTDLNVALRSSGTIQVDSLPQVVGSVPGQADLTLPVRAISPDGRRLFVIAGPLVIVVDTVAADPTVPWTFFTLADDTFREGGWSASGERIVLRSPTSSVLLDLKTGGVQHLAKGARAGPHALVAGGGGDLRLQSWGETGSLGIAVPVGVPTYAVVSETISTVRSPWVAASLVVAGGVAGGQDSPVQGVLAVSVDDPTELRLLQGPYWPSDEGSGPLTPLAWADPRRLLVRRVVGEEDWVYLWDTGSGDLAKAMQLTRRPQSPDIQLALKSVS